MQSTTLLFRYVELKILGIEILLEGRDVVLVLRQPAKQTIRRTLTTLPRAEEKRQ